MSNEKREQRLALAKRIILEVRDSFCNEKTICERCGHENFTSWNEHQLRDQLNGAVTRLERVIERMFNTDGVEKFRNQE